MFQGLAAFPNVEVRLFNPFAVRGKAWRADMRASLREFRRLNHRMHNKLFIADGAMAVMGGREHRRRIFCPQRDQQLCRHGRPGRR